MAVFGHIKKGKGSRFVNRFDALSMGVDMPLRGGVHGGFLCRIGRKAESILRQGRKELMAKLPKVTGKVRKVRDRETPHELPKTFSDYVAAKVKSEDQMPHMVKDTVIPLNLKLTKVPDAPLPGQAPTLWAAKKEAEIELHMVKGFTEARDISRKVGLNERKTREMMERIKARWSIAGSAYDIKKGRGEALRYLGVMKAELWKLVENKENSSDVKTYSLSLLTRLFGTQLMLEGVTQDAIEDLSRATDDTGEVMQRMRRQRSLAGVAGKLLDLVLVMREQNKAKLPPIVDVTPADGDSEEGD